MSWTCISASVSLATRSPVEKLGLSDVTLLYVYLRIFLLEVTAFSSSSCRFSCNDLEYSIARLTQFKVSKIAIRLTLDSIFSRVHEERAWRLTESTRGFVHDFAPWKSYFIVMTSSRIGCLSRRSIQEMFSRIIRIDRHLFFCLAMWRFTRDERYGSSQHISSISRVALFLFYMFYSVCIRDFRLIFVRGTQVLRTKYKQCRKIEWTVQRATVN